MIIDVSVVKVGIARLLICRMSALADPPSYPAVSLCINVGCDTETSCEIATRVIVTIERCPVLFCDGKPATALEHA